MGDGAWLAQNLWDHYAFTGDKEYLRTRAYPILKELCEFWEDILKENPDVAWAIEDKIRAAHGLEFDAMSEDDSGDEVLEG